MQHNDIILTSLTKGELRDMIRESFLELGQGRAAFSSPSAKEDAILDSTQAAAFLRISKATLYGLTSSRTVPFLKRGKRLFFKREDLIAWLEDGRHQTIEEIESSAHVSMRKRKGGRL